MTNFNILQFDIAAQVHCSNQIINCSILKRGVGTIFYHYVHICQTGLQILKTRFRDNRRPKSSIQQYMFLVGFWGPRSFGASVVVANLKINKRLMTYQYMHNRYYIMVSWWSCNFFSVDWLRYISVENMANFSKNCQIRPINIIGNVPIQLYRF